MSILNDPSLQSLLDRLHRQSESEVPELANYFKERLPADGLSNLHFDDEAYRFLGGKMVAIEPAKAEFCHLLVCAVGAQQIIEIGTSHGVSTLYLADAVRGNGGGLVIASEHEPHKSSIARQHFLEAGVDDLIELREGDLRETLKVIEHPVDFVLIDIWMDMARPAIELVAPHLRTGAVVICDNTTTYREAYADYFAFLENPNNGFVTRTLPFDGGLELSVKT